MFLAAYDTCDCAKQLKVLLLCDCPKGMLYKEWDKYPFNVSHRTDGISIALGVISTCLFLKIHVAAPECTFQFPQQCFIFSL